MHWPVSLPLICGSLLPLALAASHQSEKHYAIMDNDWYTAGFVPYLVALDGGVEVLGLASGTCPEFCTFGSLLPFADVNTNKLIRYCKLMAATSGVARGSNS